MAQFPSCKEVASIFYPAADRKSVKKKTAFSDLCVSRGVEKCHLTQTPPGSCPLVPYLLLVGTCLLPLSSLVSVDQTGLSVWCRFPRVGWLFFRGFFCLSFPARPKKRVGKGGVPLLDHQAKGAGWSRPPPTWPRVKPNKTPRSWETGSLAGACRS